jgi:predicted nucleic acid-binding protein
MDELARSKPILEVIRFGRRRPHNAENTRYADREIDFADASLVWLANRRGTTLIATTDFDDFETYRLPNRKSFKLLISRAAVG